MLISGIYLRPFVALKYSRKVLNCVTLLTLLQYITLVESFINRISQSVLLSTKAEKTLLG